MYFIFSRHAYKNNVFVRAHNSDRSVIIIQSLLLLRNNVTLSEAHVNNNVRRNRCFVRSNKFMDGRAGSARAGAPTRRRRRRRRRRLGTSLKRAEVAAVAARPHHRGHSPHTQQIEVWPSRAAIFLTFCRLRFQVNTQIYLKLTPAGVVRGCVVCRACGRRERVRARWRSRRDVGPGTVLKEGKKKEASSSVNQVRERVREGERARRG